MGDVDPNAGGEPTAETASAAGADAVDAVLEGEVLEGTVVEDVVVEDGVIDAAGLASPVDGDAGTISEEAIVTLIAERDEYLDALQRLKADFSNARRRADEQASLLRQQAAADLVNKLLPILDSAQAALDQGVEEVRPLSSALFDVLEAQGLARVDPVGEAFDPEHHEAVMFESGEGEQVVVETMRLGYTWNERVLRAAMVKVRG